jgi:DNA-binding IclR family transcriptional regulator
LAEVRQRGYALDIKEATEYACCAAIAIRARGKAVAALSCSFPSLSFDPADIGGALTAMRDLRSTAEARLALIDPGDAV